MIRNTSGLKRGGGPGRPKGVPNKATIEAKGACSELVDEPEYRANLKKRLIAGKLAPAVECMLWLYAKGKPKETVELVDDPSRMSDEELAEALVACVGRLALQHPFIASRLALLKVPTLALEGETVQRTGDDSEDDVTTA